ncbi:MAG: NUDIX domain-containing protein [Ilumatobacteraceae bacterium]
MSPTREYDPAAVPIRQAATVMLVRDADVGHEQGIEVFMLRRTLAAVFGSGMYVFPGGKVETADGTDVDRAHRLAAIRECFEEAGVLLARNPSGDFVDDGHPSLDHREAIHDGTAELLALCAEHGLTPAIDELVWVAHWITPIGEQRRFDTRFYLVPAPGGQAHSHDDSETIDSLWVSPAEALQRQASGELTMMPPTVKNLQFLAEHTTVDRVMAAAHALPEPPCILPRIKFVDGAIVGVLLPGEPGYDDLA